MPVNECCIESRVRLGCQKQSQFLCENGFTAAYRAYHHPGAVIGLKLPRDFDRLREACTPVPASSQTSRPGAKHFQLVASSVCPNVTALRRLGADAE
jgi:hypothetical protein